MNCYRIDHELSAARFIREYLIRSSFRQLQFHFETFKQTMRSEIEIPGDAPYVKSTTLKKDSEIELLKSSNRKNGKKIFVGVLLLSAVMFCIVIILRYRGILKLRSHNKEIQNVIYQHRQKCVYFSRKDSMGTLSNICPRNK